MNPRSVNFDFKGAYHDEGSALHVFMQRQGVSETVNAATPWFFVEVNRWHDGDWAGEVHYPNDAKCHGRQAGQIYATVDRTNDRWAVLRDVAFRASELAGKPVTFDAATLSYMYGWAQYEYQADDVILSPVFYQPGTDTIRLAPQNYCLVAFEDGNFDRPILDMDGATVPYRPHIERALRDGFHECDRKRGPDYCKRRLAWLAGAYIASMNEGRAAVCDQNMEIAK